MRVPSKAAEEAHSFKPYAVKVASMVLRETANLTV